MSLRRSPVPRCGLLAVLLLGLGLRLVALPLPGTLDVSVWKIWAFAASTDAPWRLYGVGGTPAQRRNLRYLGKYTTADYPPLALDVLAVVGRVYRAARPAFPDGPALTAAVKLPVLAADAALAWWLWSFARRRRPEEARRILGGWWLGPAVLLNGAALGYLDPLCALPATGAFLTAAGGAWVWSGALAVAAAGVKAQAIVPLAALAWWAWRDGWRTLGRLAVGGIPVLGLTLGPVVAAGAWPNFVVAMQSLTRHDMVSGNSANLWWLYTWLFRAWYDRDLGVWAALTTPVRILGLSTVEELGHASPKPLALLLVVLVSAWAVWRATRATRAQPPAPSGPRDARPRWAIAAALGAFLVHAYFSLAVQVHENHLFLALPLALVASIVLRPSREIAATLAVIQFLNLFLFYGVSEGIGWTPPRSITIIDATVWLSMASVAAFVRHAVLFGRLTRTEDARI